MANLKGILHLKWQRFYAPPPPPPRSCRIYIPCNIHLLQIKHVATIWTLVFWGFSQLHSYWVFIKIGQNLTKLKPKPKILECAFDGLWFSCCDAWKSPASCTIFVFSSFTFFHLSRFQCNQNLPKAVSTFETKQWDEWVHNGFSTHWAVSDVALGGFRL